VKVGHRQTPNTKPLANARGFLRLFYAYACG
jgi:hypothetical protein